MTGNEPKVTFNIGSQHGNVSNVAGDMTVYGGQHYTALPADMIRQELNNIHAIISSIEISPEARKNAVALLADAGRELSRPGCEPEKVAWPVRRLAGLLSDIGAISAAGASLIGPFKAIASWLGPAGQAILHLIT
jgi:isopentenyl diphosphate isomerase/L-lactate dehydrogenase-like FMN-dependent dehydrogenase